MIINLMGNTLTCHGYAGREEAFKFLTKTINPFMHDLEKWSNIL